jgi:hypothetical protein
MAFDIFVRVQTKWRGLLVYTLLQAFTHFVTRVVYYEADDPRLRIFANLVSIATTLYCFSNTVLLLFKDREGDEAWPPLW